MGLASFYPYHKTNVSYSISCVTVFRYNRLFIIHVWTIYRYLIWRILMSGFRVGKLFGIDIHVDWSWFLIFILVSWSLSATFGQFRPGWPAEMRWGMALLGSFIFFASVLAHELAHSLAAQSRGVPVRSITLFMFGGVANIQKEPASPAEELYITIVGPLTSLFLGAVFLVWGTGRLHTLGINISVMSVQMGAFRIVL